MVRLGEVLKLRTKVKTRLILRLRPRLRRSVTVHRAKKSKTKAKDNGG